MLWVFRHADRILSHDLGADDASGCGNTVMGNNYGEDYYPPYTTGRCNLPCAGQWDHQPQSRSRSN